VPPSAIPVRDGRTTGTESSPGLPRAASSLDHARLILERRTAGSNRGLEPVWVRPEGTSLTDDGELLYADTQGSGYVHWFGKGDVSGTTGTANGRFASTAPTTPNSPIGTTE
jgi:hypothetical protein